MCDWQEERDAFYTALRYLYDDGKMRNKRKGVYAYINRAAGDGGDGRSSRELRKTYRFVVVVVVTEPL